MPMPLGHTAAGLAIHDIYSKSNTSDHLWKTLTFIIILTNLPDIDVLIGLVMHGNGNFFHRGPTHSLLFALFAAFVASNSWRCWSKIPKISPLLCFLLVFSHIAADAVLTASPVSFWWPLELHLSVGHSGWREIIRSVLFGAFRDLGTIVVSGVVIFLNRLIRHRPIPIPVTLSRLVKGR
jgi:inner membrane protein